MAPQPRGVVPPEHLQRIRTLQQLASETEEQLHAAVAEALKAGASVRELAKAAGLSTTTVQKWGREHGWPTEQQKAAWEKPKHDNDAFRASLAAAEALIAHVDPDA